MSAMTPGLRRLHAGFAAASIAGWAFMIVLALYAYDHGGAAAVGLAALARMVPAGLAAPFASLLADRRSRRAVLVASCVARALLGGAAALLVLAGASLGAVLAAAALLTVAGTVHRPAQAALLPTLARSPGELAAANGMWSAVDNAGFLVGALGGGVAVGATSTQAAFTAIAVLYGLAALTLTGLTPDAVGEHRAAEPLSRPARELALGLRVIVADRRLRLVAGVITAATLAEGAVDVLVVVLALSLLDLGSGGVGLLNAAWGAGGLIGGALLASMLGRGRLAAGFSAGAVLAGAALVGVAAVPELAVALPLLMALGFGYALMEAGGLTFVQRLAGDAVLGRVFGVLEAGYWLATGLGAMVAPLLVSALGTRAALAAVGVSLVAAVAARARALGALALAQPVPERAFALLRGSPILAPVPLAELETLAQRAVPVALGAGETLFAQGDAGDRFYVIDSGRLEIVRDGVTCAVDEPGDCFGETALLRDCPRNATVRAIDDADLYALDRSAFLTVVTGHPHAERAADRIVNLHLQGAAA
jgi:MFS family permease